MIDFTDVSDVDLGRICWNGTTNNPVFAGPSDIAIKDNVTTLTRDDLSRVIKTSLFNYHLKRHPKGRLSSGFIAQNLEKEFPEAVFEVHDYRVLDGPRPGVHGYTTETIFTQVNYPTTHTAETTWTSETISTSPTLVVEWTSTTTVLTTDHWTTETQTRHVIDVVVKNIDRSALIEPMFMAIQQQQRIIENLQQARAIQKNRMDALQSRIEALEAR